MKDLIKKILFEELLVEEKVVNFDLPNNNFVVIAGGPGAGKSFITQNTRRVPKDIRYDFYNI